MTAKDAAVLRLLDRWRAEDKELAQYIADALAAERRATVERIAEKVALADLDALTPDVNRAEVNAILDEEAAR